MVRDEQSRSDVWTAGAQLCATGAKGREVRDCGEEEEAQGRQSWKGGDFAPVPSSVGLALAAL